MSAKEGSARRPGRKDCGAGAFPQLRVGFLMRHKRARQGPDALVRPDGEGEFFLRGSEQAGVTVLLSCVSPSHEIYSTGRLCRDVATKRAASPNKRDCLGPLTGVNCAARMATSNTPVVAMTGT